MIIITDVKPLVACLSAIYLRKVFDMECRVISVSSHPALKLKPFPFGSVVAFWYNVAPLIKVRLDPRDSLNTK